MTTHNTLDIGELRQIAGWLEAAGVGFIEIARGDNVARMTLGGAVSKVAPVTTKAAAQPQQHIRALHAGRFMKTHPSRTSAIADAGAQVKAGDIVAIVQVAELCLPVIAPADGVLGEWLVEEGATVGYGAALAALT
ncbi:biotin/lipoyl-containing protein [Caballeronia sp. BR00000012568055]|jgi:acetyl-CoA carboxylase biotin carboxyl carrier protein|uniref:biotin/lipoyl-containing protein n=1 Tax=Caballeronia sp. BR00000012568055 TaxID=2918761 RepID=UPI0023F7DE92|nr:biotin/lipoyl-containing protein [Caballeronia sp. BR00000012568055]